MNIPNLLSLSRIFLIPVFLYLLFSPAPWSKIAAMGVFILASVTDILDGWSARTLKQESELGKFLDPLADKFLVIATLISFVIIDPYIPMWMILVIVGRDFLITVMRYTGIKKGMALRTSRFGKIKTAFQMVSIVIIIMVFIVKSFGTEIFLQNHIDQAIHLKTLIRITLEMDNTELYKWILIGPYWLMMIVTILTALSGIRYLMYNWRLLLPPYHPKNGSNSN